MSTLSLSFMGRTITFANHSAVCAKRVNSFLSKEPDTVKWISETLTAGDVLWDIGANIGIYALPAATRVSRVLAFEPHPGNFSSLVENAAANGLGNLMCSNLAIAGTDGFELLRMSSLDAGVAMNSVSDIGYRGERVSSALIWPVTMTTGTTLVERFGVTEPTAIKLDVDGIEHEIVPALPWSRVRTAIIEVDMHRSSHLAMVADIEARGFTWDRVKAEASRRTSGPNEGVGNIIFTRL